MVALQDTRNIQFRVETLVVRNGRKLGKLRPDDDGYFCKIPVAALGVSTRNNTYYEVDSFRREVSNPNTMFNQRLVGGQLYGELGHPDISAMEKPQAIARLVDIREANWSHHIRAVETGEALEGGGCLLLADIKPTGIGAETVRENFENPFMNTAFSLRAITDARQQGALSYRTMKKLVTFDFVGAGGYYEASKIFAPSMESFDVEITALGNAALRECSMENFTNSELNDIFGTNNVGIRREVITVVKPVDGKFDRFQSSVQKSKFRDMFGG